MGSSHSWTPLFADDGAWLMDTSGIKHIVWSATDNPTQVILPFTKSYYSKNILGYEWFHVNNIIPMTGNSI